MLKKSVSLIVAMSFLLVCTAAALAVERKLPTTGVQQAQPIAQDILALFKCPTGWQKKPNALACTPSKPAPITCPKGYTYYEKLTCSASTFFGGCQSEGCEVGCFKAPEPPK
jgi:hypothetical protein